MMNTGQERKGGEGRETAGTNVLRRDLLAGNRELGSIGPAKETEIPGFGTKA